MEVGVDVGTLQATVQANMPPQRFNYQQRVGRAGRRRQAFSVVLTVCRNRSHDLHYFRNPESITGDAPPPPFLSKSLPEPALRFARKAWLWHAFDRVRADCAKPPASPTPTTSSGRQTSTASSSPPTSSSAAGRGGSASGLP